MAIVNDPEVVEQLTQLHDAYERALVANDVDALTDFFWDSPQAVRFGPKEQLYGTEAIATFRKNHRPNATDRVLRKRVILIVAPGAASIMSEYNQNAGGHPQLSRQSQIWVKFETGWKIVSAHVSTGTP